MVFRRRRRGDDTAEPSAGGSGDSEWLEQHPHEPANPQRPDGPFDASEVERAGENRVDLGGLLVRPGPGMQLQLQVDERSGTGTAVMIVHGDAAVQLVAVAAPRSSGLWEETKAQIAADARNRGGTVQEAPGPFGTELRLVLPAKTPEGKNAARPSRVCGVDGPRWLLRATFLGTAVTDAQAFARLVKVVRDTVVVRGDGPMAPGDVIALKPPRPPADGPAPAGG